MSSVAIPPGLEPEPFAGRLYDALAPLAAADATVGWALLILCNGIGLMFELVEEWVRDNPDGPGWSLLMDLDRCPDEALPWLGQFVGVRLLPDSTPAQQRARIASTDGFKRGTRQALIGAATATLTGRRTVLFRERDGDPYVLGVQTYTDQTPNPAATQSALVAQKPGGLVLNYTVTGGQTWQQVRDNHATWQSVKNAYIDWQAVATDEPG